MWRTLRVFYLVVQVVKSFLNNKEEISRMKKLLVLVMAVVMILAFAAVSMAEATLSGEVDTGYKTFKADNSDGVSSPYLFAKIVLNGKLGDDIGLTQDPGISETANANSFTFDEASVTFTESFGTIKFGDWAWNNNPKDILDTYRGDLRSEFAVAGSFKVADGFTVGAVYGFGGTDDKGKTNEENGRYGYVNSPYGVDLGYATDTYGADLIVTNNFWYSHTDTVNNVVVSSKAYTCTGVQGWYKVGDFKPFIQYETVDVSDKTNGTNDPVNTIIGATYESADVPVYARVEYDLSKIDHNIANLGADDAANEWGVRLGYKLASGVKFEFQDFVNKANATQTYLKVIAVF
jgi:Gram-negative porin